MKELLRDPVVQQTRVMPTEDSENPLDQLTVAGQEQANPIKVGLQRVQRQKSYQRTCPLLLKLYIFLALPLRLDGGMAQIL